MQECCSRLLELDWRKGHSPLKGDETQYTGCVACDDLLREKCEASVHGHEPPAWQFSKNRQPWQRVAQDAILMSMILPQSDTGPGWAGLGDLPWTL